MTDERNAAQYAAAIAEARQRLIGFAEGCSEADWSISPLDGDSRSVGGWRLTPRRVGCGSCAAGAVGGI